MHKRLKFWRINFFKSAHADPSPVMIMRANTPYRLHPRSS